MTSWTSCWARAYQCRDEFDSADSPGLALIALRSGLLAVYDEAEQLKDSLAEEGPAVPRWKA